MEKCLCIVLLFCLPWAAVKAQDAPPLPSFTTKIGLLNFIDPVIPSANLLAEYRLGKRFSIQAEAGVILGVSDNWDVSLNGCRGLRLRPALRYYSPGSDYRLFVELMGFRRNLTLDLSGNFTINPSLGAAYNQRLDYQARLRKTGLFLNIGYQIPFRGGWMLEVGGGAGFAHREEHYAGVPEQADYQDENMLTLFWNPRERLSPDVIPALMLYFNIGKVLFWKAP